MTPDVHTLIVGAGFSGIGTGIELDKAGLRDYLIVEAGDAPGGTWYWNTYPGIGVDIPSFSYQFSFEQNPDWSRTYAAGNELQRYAEHCVDKYGLRSRIRFSTKVVAAAFDEQATVWRVDLGSGEQITARFLINGCGVMTTPKAPDDRRPGDLFRPQHAHRPLGSQRGSERQTGGHHRHRRLGGPGDRGDSAGSREADSLSAHPDLVLPEVRFRAAQSRSVGDADSRRQDRLLR